MTISRRGRAGATLAADFGEGSRALLGTDPRELATVRSQAHSPYLAQYGSGPCVGTEAARHGLGAVVADRGRRWTRPDPCVLRRSRYRPVVPSQGRTAPAG